MPNQYTHLSLRQRILSRVEKTEGGCWVWTGKKAAGRYGSLRKNGKQVLAHRASYEEFVGPIPDGMEIDHLCRTSLCVNPEHLEPVSHQENVRRGEAGKHFSDRTHCPQGHVYEGDNLYLRPDGGRGCKTCRRIVNRKHYHLRIR